MLAENEGIEKALKEDSRLLAAFREQLGEFVVELQRLAVDPQPLSSSQIYEVLRLAHRFKGDAHFLGLKGCRRFASGVETRLRKELVEGSFPEPKTLLLLVKLLIHRQTALSISLTPKEEAFFTL